MSCFSNIDIDQGLDLPQPSRTVTQPRFPKKEDKGARLAVCLPATLAFGVT